MCSFKKTQPGLLHLVLAVCSTVGNPLSTVDAILWYSPGDALLDESGAAGPIAFGFDSRPTRESDCHVLGIVI